MEMINLHPANQVEWSNRGWRRLHCQNKWRNWPHRLERWHQTASDSLWTRGSEWRGACRAAPSECLSQQHRRHSPRKSEMGKQCGRGGSGNNCVCGVRRFCGEEIHIEGDNMEGRGCEEIHWWGRVKQRERRPLVMEELKDSWEDQTIDHSYGSWFSKHECEEEGIWWQWRL